MNEFMKVLLSLSCSGTLLFFFVLGLKLLYKNKFSRRWQYYIWLIVVLRFFIPFMLDTVNVGKLFEMLNTTVITNESIANPNVTVTVNVNDNETKQTPASKNDIAATAAHKTLNIYVYLFFVWSALALILFVRKITTYQGFIWHIQAGNIEVSDIKVLNLLSDCEEKLNIKTKVELYRNELIASPTMIGFFRPSIILPVGESEDRELIYVFTHELIHYKQRDMFYKWLIQIAVCVHWFNPFVHLLENEVNMDCELSCDEAVISVLDDKARREYGDTLISFLKPNNFYKNSIASVTLTEGVEQLKERLGAIMNFKKTSKTIRILTCVLTMCIIFGAVFVGFYPVYAASDSLRPTKMDNPVSTQSDDSPVMETMEFKGTTYYLVFNETQLRAIGRGEYGMDQNYMQQADIQLSTNEWIPIGTWDNPFTGTFNGNGFEIIGLTMTDPDAKIIGLFGVAKNAHFYNVTMRDYDILNAGRNASEKSVGAVLAIGQGSRSYDNFVYPKEAGEDVYYGDKPSYTIEGTLSEADQYYEAGSLLLFQVVFSRMDEEAQKAWLDKIYMDGEIAFFSVSIDQLNPDSLLIGSFAEKSYEDGAISFFKVLADCMTEEMLERWLDRALDDGKTSFQSVMFEELEMYEELDALEKEWAEKQLKEYQTVGVTKNGKNYYYQGQLVDIFLDQRPDSSFHTLDINPKGVISIKIIRNTEGEITGVSYMTVKEVTELLGEAEETRAVLKNR